VSPEEGSGLVKTLQVLLQGQTGYKSVHQTGKNDSQLQSDYWKTNKQ
jgi:hypothetical protein